MLNSVTNLSVFAVYHMSITYLAYFVCIEYLPCYTQPKIKRRTLVYMIKEISATYQLVRFDHWIFQYDWDMHRPC